jgi:hypothetical protein
MNYWRGRCRKWFQRIYDHSRASVLRQQPLLTADEACDGRMCNGRRDAHGTTVEISAGRPGSQV